MKEIDDTVYEVDCKKITLGADSFGRSSMFFLFENFHLIDHFAKRASILDIGANPSAEEAEETLEEGQKQVIDVVHFFRLNFMGDEASGTRAFPTKKDYQGQLKGEW